MNPFLRYLADKNSAHTHTHRHTPLTTRPDGLRRAGNNYVATDLPEILNFVKLCYDQSSPLCFGDYTLLSDEGAQQGDPLGPLLFRLTTKRLTRNISSELNLWFLNDGSVGDDIDVLIRDFQTVRQLSWGLLSTKLSVNSFVTIRKLINNFRKLQGRQSP